MRAIILVSMSALVLSGIPPAPLAPLTAQPAERAANPDDPDEICAPYIEGFRDAYAGGYARGLQSRTVAPPPSPPPPRRRLGQDQAAAHLRPRGNRR